MTTNSIDLNDTEADDVDKNSIKVLAFMEAEILDEYYAVTFHVPRSGLRVALYYTLILNGSMKADRYIIETLRWYGKVKIIFPFKFRAMNEC